MFLLNVNNSPISLTILLPYSIADKATTPEVGEEFCVNPAVKKISFTGSTAVGKLLMKLSSDTVKRLSLGKKAMHKELTCY